MTWVVQVAHIGKMRNCIKF